MNKSRSAPIDKVFQILILEDPIDPSRFSQSLQQNIASLKAIYPAAEYTLYDDARIREFLSEEFAPEVLDAYDLLAPFAYKADLARYCLLYTFGGLYSDLSYLHITAIEPEEDINLIAFSDIPRIHPPWSTSNALVFARPGLPARRGSAWPDPLPRSSSGRPSPGRRCRSTARSADPRHKRCRLRPSPK